MQGKVRQVAHRRGAFAREPQHWGDIITCDHMVQTDEAWTVGCDGSKDVLTVKDIATGYKMAYPMPNKSGESTVTALQKFIGQWRINRCYYDNSHEID